MKNRENILIILVPDAQVKFETWTTEWNSGVTLHSKMTSTVHLHGQEPQPFHTHSMNYESLKDALDVQRHYSVEDLEFKLQRLLAQEEVLWCNDTDTIIHKD